MIRLGLFLISFLIGIYIWFPYRIIYTSVIDKALEGKPVKISYALSEVTPFSLRFKSIEANYKGYRLKEDDLLVKINPLSIFLQRDVAAISRDGLFIRLKKQSSGFEMFAEFNRYTDPNIPGAEVNGKLYALVDVDKDILEKADADIKVRNLRLPLSGITYKLDEIRFKGTFKNGVLEISRLMIKGPIKAQIKGRVWPDFQDILSSKAKLSLRYQIAGSNFSRNFEGRLRELFNAQSLLPRP